MHKTTVSIDCFPRSTLRRRVRRTPSTGSSAACMSAHPYACVTNRTKGREGRKEGKGREGPPFYYGKQSNPPAIFPSFLLSSFPSFPSFPLSPLSLPLLHSQAAETLIVGKRGGCCAFHVTYIVAEEQVIGFRREPFNVPEREKNSVCVCVCVCGGRVFEYCL